VVKCKYLHAMLYVVLQNWHGNKMFSHGNRSTFSSASLSKVYFFLLFYKTIPESCPTCCTSFNYRITLKTQLSFWLWKCLYLSLIVLHTTAWKKLTIKTKYKMYILLPKYLDLSTLALNLIQLGGIPIFNSYGVQIYQ